MWRWDGLNSGPFSETRNRPHTKTNRRDSQDLEYWRTLYIFSPSKIDWIRSSYIMNVNKLIWYWQLKIIPLDKVTWKVFSKLQILGPPLIGGDPVTFSQVKMITSFNEHRPGKYWTTGCYLYRDGPGTLGAVWEGCHMD